MRKVTIIDYQLGNLFSVKQACEAVGINAEINSDPASIECADALILPGVGAFKEATEHLHSLGQFDRIKEEVSKGKPILGVCLGLQLMFTKSQEFGEARGLDIIPGEIKKFKSAPGLKVPHVGWNKPRQSHQKWEGTPLEVIDDGDFMYFVHSFYVVPEDENCILSNTNYLSQDFCSAIKKDNIFATQFHPEKSSNKGLSIYKSWANQNNLI